jgi:hypothetical protein
MFPQPGKKLDFATSPCHTFVALQQYPQTAFW